MEQHEILISFSSTKMSTFLAHLDQLLKQDIENVKIQNRS